MLSQLAPAGSPQAALYPVQLPPIVAVETPAEPVEPIDRVQGSVELSFVSTTGNTATQTVGTAAGLRFRPGMWVIDAEGRYLRTTADDELRAESVSSGVRAARNLFDEVAAYAETRHQRNTFTGIRRQLTAEFGISKDFLKKETQQLSAEVAIGHIDEDRLSGDDRRLTSGTAGAKLRFALSKTSTWTQNARLVTDLGNTSDWRLQHEAALAASLNAVLSLKLAHSVSYVREPVPGFGRTDAVGSAALVASF